MNPQDANNASSSTNDGDSRQFTFLVFVMSTGVIDEAVDFKLQMSPDGNSNWVDISGKAITQIPNTGDNRQAMIFVKTSELDADKPYVRGNVTVGNGTTSLISVVGLGVGAIAPPASDYNRASVIAVVE